MTREHANGLATRIAGLLGLDLALSCEWIDAQVVTDGAMGDANYSWPTNNGAIRVAIGRSDRDVVDTMLHECLHVATAEVYRSAQREFEHLAPAHQSSAEQAVQDALERHVRKLTEALLPTAMRLLREVRKGT